ncbi:MAG: GGDEF domain-containing protein [Planctomycetota bacterium]
MSETIDKSNLWRVVITSKDQHFARRLADHAREAIEGIEVIVLAASDAGSIVDLEPDAVICDESLGFISKLLQYEGVAVVATGPAGRRGWIARAVGMGAHACLPAGPMGIAVMPMVMAEAVARLELKHMASIDELANVNESLAEQVKMLETLASSDPLTGLANRRALQESLGRTIAETQRYGEDLTCLMIDLDGFKPVNDALGHARGDRILEAVADVLKMVTRESDLIARYGGDEFVVVMPRTDAVTAELVAERIIETFHQHETVRNAHEELTDDLMRRVHRDGRRVPCSMSIGMASLRGMKPEEERTSDGVLMNADRALAVAKEGGGGCVAHEREKAPVIVRSIMPTKTREAA